MKMPTARELDKLWSRHHAEWRHNAQVASQWEEASETDPKLLRSHVEGEWWETLAKCDMTLLVTREYEHLAMALTVANDSPYTTYMKLPHPSGLAVDREKGMIYLASTRNPNQVYDLQPVTGVMPRTDIKDAPIDGNPLVPVRSRFLPGCSYLHDLAFIGGKLYGNAVGQNAVIALSDKGQFERVWWPKCIETADGPVFEQNHIQLNSIAAGEDIGTSYFSASADCISARRPGHKNFPVDRRGVIFSAETREPMARGLTRPHSARLYRNRVWVDNSGYGEVGYAEDGGFKPVIKLPGWTRGLAFHAESGIAFVGTSRVIPRFKQYAPGLDVRESVCGVHAFEVSSGRVLGSIYWPYGNQIFAIDFVPRSFTLGFPFIVGQKRNATREKALFYKFSLSDSNEE